MIPDKKPEKANIRQFVMLFLVCSITILTIVCTTACISLPYNIVRGSALSVYSRTINAFSRGGILINPEHDRLITFQLRPGITMKFIWVDQIEAWVGETEVSLRQWNVWSMYDAHLIMDWMKHQPGYSIDWPVCMVSTNEAKEFCKWLQRKYEDKVILPEGYHFRLPKVSEYINYCKCGDERSFPWGEGFPPSKMADGKRPNVMGEDIVIVDEKMNHRIFWDGQPWRAGAKISGYYDGYPGPCPVQDAARNEYGIADLAGNVQEWCFAEIEDTYVLMGGDWNSWAPSHFKCDSYKIPIQKRSPFIPFIRESTAHYRSGFRVVIGKDN